jgi:polyhydroxybutyrate depolymerase
MPPRDRHYLRRMGRILRNVFLGLVAAAVVLAGLLFAFVWTPEPQPPQLSGRLVRGAMTVGGRERSYLLYLPRGLAGGAPLVMALHGSGESGARMRVATGYGFERLADEHRFAVVYPNGFEGYWNACNIVGDYSANTLGIDDVGFLTALADKLARQIGSDPRKVFAMGLSRGGHMAFRLALEAPQRFRAVAAVAANMPTRGNSRCKPHGATPSVLIVNGTRDPLNPYEGGDARLFGLFMDRGPVLSSHDTAGYFARLNAIQGAPRVQDRTELWHGTVDVELVSHDGGHVLPQPYRRYPRLLGPTPATPNGPALIWSFFEQSMKGIP